MKVKTYPMHEIKDSSALCCLATFVNYANDNAMDFIFGLNRYL